MKNFVFALIAMISSVAYAQSPGATNTTIEETESGIHLWSGRASTHTYIDEDTAIGLKPDETDSKDPYRVERYNAAREYISHLLSEGGNEAECTEKLFNQAMTQTLYPDVKLKSYEQDYSLGSLVDRGILNLSGFNILRGKAVGKDGNWFDISMKLNYRTVTIKKVRQVVRSGKVLESSSRKVVRCYFNKGGDFGHTILSVKNHGGLDLVEVSSSTHHPVMGY